MDIKLKPCPFCGGKAKPNLYLGNYAITCTDCLGMIAPYRGQTLEEAIDAWNRRADDGKIELIDRAAAINAITSFCKADNDCKEFEGEKCAGCEYYFCVREISKLPTIDAAPVRRGEWEMVDEHCNHAHEFRCTQCERSVFYDHYTRRCDYDFCPNCGADMRGVAE